MSIFLLSFFTGVIMKNVHGNDIPNLSLATFKGKVNAAQF